MPILHFTFPTFERPKRHFNWLPKLPAARGVEIGLVKSSCKRFRPSILQSSLRAIMIT
jgi:hypothetical protein